MLGGLIVLAMVSIMGNKIREVGSWADWTSGIGTIIAILVSVVITRYQVKSDRTITKEKFFGEQEYVMLNSVQRRIVENKISLQVVLKDINSNKDNISDINFDYFYDNYFKKYNEIIKPNHLYIVDMLYEYARSKDGYTSLYMTELKEVMHSFGSMEGQNDKLKDLLHRSRDDITEKSKLIQFISYNFLDDIEKFFYRTNGLEESILIKKKELRL